MGSFKDENGQSRISHILDKLKIVAPEILQGAGKLTGIQLLNHIGNAIDNKPSIDPDEYIEIKELISLEFQDMENARNSNVSIQNSAFSSWMSKNVPYILDAFIAVIWGCASAFILLKMSHLIDSDNKIDWTGLVGIYGVICTKFGTVLNFHRGSSREIENPLVKK